MGISPSNKNFMADKTKTATSVKAYGGLENQVRQHRQTTGALAE